MTFFWSWYRHQKYANRVLNLPCIPHPCIQLQESPCPDRRDLRIRSCERQEEQAVGDAFDFVRFITEDPEEYRKAVVASSCFPVGPQSVKGHRVDCDLYPEGEDAQLFRAFTEYFKGLCADYAAVWGLQQRVACKGLASRSGRRNQRPDKAIDEKLNKKLQEEYGIVENDEIITKYYNLFTKHLTGSPFPIRMSIYSYSISI